MRAYQISDVTMALELVERDPAKRLDFSFVIKYKCLVDPVNRCPGDPSPNQGG